MKLRPFALIRLKHALLHEVVVAVVIVEDEDEDEDEDPGDGALLASAHGFEAHGFEDGPDIELSGGFAVKRHAKRRHKEITRSKYSTSVNETWTSDTDVKRHAKKRHKEITRSKYRTSVNQTWTSDTDLVSTGWHTPLRCVYLWNKNH